MKLIVCVVILLSYVGTSSVQATNICTGFKIHTPIGEQPLVAGMTICPYDYPEWNIKSVCNKATTNVITKLYDNTDKLTIRRGNDKTKADGECRIKKSIYGWMQTNPGFD